MSGMADKETILEQPNVVQFMVLARSRTGSTLLDSYLGSHPNIFTMGERFRILLDKTIIQAINRVMPELPPIFRARGFKMFYNHPINIDPQKREEGFDMLAAQPNLRVIHLKRRNILRTLVSYEIAVKAGMWMVRKKDRERLDKLANYTFSFSESDLRKAFEEQRMLERIADERFKSGHLLQVCYEDLVQNPESTFRKVTDFLDVPPRSPTTEYVKINTRPIREILENYDALKADFAGSEWEPFFCDDATEALPLAIE